MKANIYDWSDEYDQTATTMIKFVMEHASINNLYDLGLPMEVHRTRLVGKDFSKTYDLTKTYDVSDYRSFEGVNNTLEQLLITENCRKMQDGTLHRWLCKGIENYSDNSDTTDNMGSDTFRRLFDMGIVINMNNFGRIKDNLNNDEAAVVDNMCKSRADVNGFLSQYDVVLDRIMQLVSNLGLARCYSSLHKPRFGDTERKPQSRSYNVSHTKIDVTHSLPLVSVRGSELPYDSFIAHTYDIEGTSNGWRNIMDIRNVVRLHYTLDVKTKSVENKRLAAIIVGYLEMRRLITCRIVVGDVERLDEVADEMHKVFFEVNSVNWTRMSTFEKISIMLEHIDEVCELIDDQVTIKDFFNGQLDTTLTRAKRIVVQSDDVAYQCMCRAISLTLSDKKRTCRLCMDGLDRHKSMNIVVNCMDNALVCLGCLCDDRNFSKYMEGCRSDSNDEGAKPLEINSSNVDERLNDVLAKLRAGTLNQYVTDCNTCYLTGQHGKIIIPLIIDTLILRLCGINSYLSEDKKLIIISRWDNKYSIVQKPTHILVGDLKLNEVVHLTEQVVLSVKVIRNCGRIMVAGQPET